jgi:8-oxo-dGTP diphosphatase
MPERAVVAIGPKASIIRPMSKEVIRVVAAVIERDGRYLITQRNASATLPLLWEFPGGRVERDETDEDALAREVRGRIGVDVEVGPKVGEHTHEYASYEVHLTMFSCKLPAGATPYPATVNDLRWVTSREFLDYDFPPADEKTMNKLLMRN